MAMFSEITSEEAVTNLVKYGCSHADIVSWYQSHYPNSCGLRARSVRRHRCKQNGIKGRTDEELVEIVQRFVSLYGYTYGRKMMQGSIPAFLNLLKPLNVAHQIVSEIFWVNFVSVDC